MSLPEDFSPWEHLLSTLTTYHNQLVRQEFIDIGDEIDLSIPRSSLQIACLLDADDTVNMILLRLWLFFFHARKAADLQAEIYGTPVSDFDMKLQYKPKVTLYFQEDAASVIPGNQPIRSQIQFTLHDQTAATINKAYATEIATLIKEEFALEGGYRWSRGTVLVTYKDLINGMNFQIYVLDSEVAITLIEKICTITSVAFNESLIVIHTSQATFLSDPGLQEIYGKERKKPRQRPITFVRFHKAVMTVWGLNKGVVLIDRYRFNTGLVNV